MRVNLHFLENQQTVCYENLLKHHKGKSTTAQHSTYPVKMMSLSKTSLKCKTDSTAGRVAAVCMYGAHPELDKFLALNIGGDQHLVDHTALTLPQAAADITLGEALGLPGGLVRQGCRLANNHILTCERTDKMQPEP